VVALIIEFGDGRGGAWLVGVVILAAASLATIGLVLLIWTFQLVAVGGVEVVLVDFMPNFGHEPTLFFANDFCDFGYWHGLHGGWSGRLLECDPATQDGRLAP
jgi:hypothetical protein